MIDTGKNPDRRRLLTVAGLGVAGLGAAACQPRTTAQSTATSDHRTDYSLQGRVAGITTPAEVSVVGCGGFGSWPALFCALAGVTKLSLIDMGEVEASDLQRTPFQPKHIGVPKAEALADLIHQFRPEATATSQHKMFQMTDIGDLSGIVFDGTDDPTLNDQLPAALAQRGMRYISGFYSADTFAVYSEPVPGLRFSRGDETPTWTAISGLAGLMSVYSAFGSPLNFMASPRRLDVAAGGRASFAAEREDLVAK